MKMALTEAKRQAQVQESKFVIFLVLVLMLALQQAKTNYRSDITLPFKGIYLS